METTQLSPPLPRARTGRWLGRMSNRLGAFGMTAVFGLGAIGGLVQNCNPPPSPQQQVVNITNQRRAEAGLAPVSVDSRLMNAAQAHSVDQARRGRMTHTGSDGSNGGTRITRAGYTWSKWGENVAAGYSNATSVMNGWMGSSSHRANILNRSMKHIGVGLAYSSNGTTYWTMVVAAPG